MTTATSTSLTLEQFRNKIKEVAFPWATGFFREINGCLYYFSDQVDISYNAHKKFSWSVRHTGSSIETFGYSCQEAWAKFLRA